MGQLIDFMTKEVINDQSEASEYIAGAVASYQCDCGCIEFTVFTIDDRIYGECLDCGTALKFMTDEEDLNNNKNKP